MAKFKYSAHLKQSDVSAFDNGWLPGQSPPNSGIYRCKNCGDEIVVPRGTAIPTNHHEHIVLGPVIWQLLVFAQEHPK
ncbi:hypothetical protein [Rhizobium oryzicola]|uniref:Protein L n=1 Tax=Rhizobium oryzicola TaxID=1232668 RepID=A0ABT8SSX2_9HYPH|nr:hypothetical protein [Rhizobium oryzicola]MDO1581504.1 hypothetical protein [Rhizobium oryzicola]